MLKINLQRFAEEEGKEETVETGGDTGNTENSPENKDDNNDKTVTMTQAQIDDLINKAFAKGARKANATKNQQAKDTTSGEQSVEADKKLQLANERLLEGTIKGIAADVNVSSKGAKVAAKMCDFSDCFDKDGNLNETAVKENLEDFLKEYPEFSVKTKEGENANKGFRQQVGAGSKDDSGSASEDELYTAFGIKKK